MKSSTAAARAIVRHSILSTIIAAFETYPERDVAEILELCVPALVADLAYALEIYQATHEREHARVDKALRDFAELASMMKR